MEILFDYLNCKDPNYFPKEYFNNLRSKFVKLECISTKSLGEKSREILIIMNEFCRDRGIGNLTVFLTSISKGFGELFDELRVKINEKVGLLEAISNPVEIKIQ